MKYLSVMLLGDLCDQSEKNITKAITEWQQLPNVRLLAQPGEGRWSAIQCIEHLNSYGRYYLPAMEKAILNASETKPAVYFKSSWLGNYFYKLMLVENNGRLKKKLRSPKDHRPAGNLIVHEVLSEFINQQERLLQLIELAKKTDLNKARVPISISAFIKLKLGDTLLFYVAHINRHMLQAQKAINAEYFKSPAIGKMLMSEI